MPSEELSNLVLGLRLETDFDDNGSLRHTVARDETLEPRSEIVECWVPDQFPASGQRGRHSAVRLEQRDTDKSQKRVVKEVGKFSDGQLRVDYVRELEALALLAGSESHFVRVHGWFENQDSVFFAMDYLELGDFGRYLSSPLPVDQTHQITSQLLQALEFLHSQNLCHHALSPSNILVEAQSPEWKVKITGFGTAKYRKYDRDTLVTLPMNVVEYTSPEQLGIRESEPALASASDMWSLGVLIFKLLTNATPFRSVYHLIEYNSESIPLPEIQRIEMVAPEVFRTTVEELLAVEPKNRPSARFCNKKNWDDAIPRDAPPTFLARTDTSYSAESLARVSSSIETPGTSIHSDHVTSSPSLRAREGTWNRKIPGQQVVIQDSSHVEKEVVSEALASNILVEEKEVLCGIPSSQDPRSEKQIAEPDPAINTGSAMVLRSAANSNQATNQSQYRQRSSTGGSSNQAEAPHVDRLMKSKSKRLQKLQATLFRSKSSDETQPRLDLLKCQEEMTKLATKNPTKAADRGLKYIRDNFKTSFPLFQKCDDCVRCYFKHNGFSLIARTRGPFCQVHTRQPGIMPFSPLHFFAMARQDVGTAGLRRFRSCVSELQCLIELASSDPTYVNYALQFSVTNSDGLMEMTPLWLAALDRNQEVLNFLLSSPAINFSEGLKSLCLLTKLGIPPLHHESILQAFNHLAGESPRYALRQHMSSNGRYPNMPWVFASANLLDQVLVKCGEGSADESVPLQTQTMLLPSYLPLAHALAICPIATTKSQFPYSSRLELFEVLLKHGADMSRAHEERGSINGAYSQRLSRGLEMLAGSLPTPRIVDIICDEVCGLVEILDSVRKQNPEQQFDRLRRLCASFDKLNHRINADIRVVEARHDSYASRGTTPLFRDSIRVRELEALDHDHKQTMFNICNAAERTHVLLKELGAAVETIEDGTPYEPHRFFEGTEIQVNQFLNERNTKS